jgi:hypothetical protein
MIPLFVLIYWKSGHSHPHLPHFMSSDLIAENHFEMCPCGLCMTSMHFWVEKKIALNWRWWCLRKNMAINPNGFVFPFFVVASCERQLKWLRARILNWINFTRWKFGHLKSCYGKNYDAKKSIFCKLLLSLSFIFFLLLQIIPNAMNTTNW